MTIAVVMGSISDWEQMKACCEMLDAFKVTYMTKVLSAHRMPTEMATFADEARDQGISVIIAGAGGAAHLPGMIAAQTTVPVIGVPMQSRALQGMDSLLSIVQMPKGVPVATMAIGSSGAANAALFAIRLLGMNDKDLQQKLKKYAEDQRNEAISSGEQLND